MDGDPTDSALIESNLSAGRHANLYGRAEYVGKEAHDLAVPGDRHFGLASVSLGHVYTIEPLPAWMVGLGVRGNVLLVPEGLEGTYGSRTPVGALVYVQARPAEHAGSSRPVPKGHH